MIDHQLQVIAVTIWRCRLQNMTEDVVVQFLALFKRFLLAHNALSSHLPHSLGSSSPLSSDFNMVSKRT